MQHVDKEFPSGLSNEDEEKMKTSRGLVDKEYPSGFDDDYDKNKKLVSEASKVQARDLEFLDDLKSDGFNMKDTKKVIASLKREYGLSDSESQNALTKWKEHRSQ